MKATKFKSTELGPIPVDWEVKKLGEIAEVNPPCYSCRPSKFVYVDLESVKGGSLVSENVINSANAPSRAQRQFSKNDVLYQTVRPYQRNNLFVEFDAANYIASTGYAVIRAKCSDARYVYAWVNSPEFVSCVLDNCTGTSYPAINPKKLAEISVAVPPLAEQRRIAKALSDVDELISALGKLIEKKRNIKTGAMRQLLTGKTRLPGFGNSETQRQEGAEFKMTELGPIPVDWEVKRLGDVVNILDNRRVPLSESQRKSGTFPYCGANGIVDYIDRYEFDEESILIAEDGGNFSDFANRAIAYKMSGKYWVNNHAHVLTAKAGCDLDYLLFHLSHKDITDIISGGTRAKLTRGQLENIIISLPPLAEQKAIAAVLSDMDAENAALEAKRAKYESIKQGMMQELLTGRTRLEA